MKTLVIYYSYTGKTRKIAEDVAKKENAALVEVKEKSKRSKLSAFFLGAIAANKRKPVKILPLDCDVSSFDKMVILMPIWAGCPAPVMNNVIELLPKGKEVALIFTSASGNSSASAQQTKALIAATGCKVVSYADQKT